MGGKKDVLGMWVGENESAKYWATVLNSLKNRGVEDILIACMDNLTGFASAIEAVFPKTEIQNCIIHQLRNSSKYVSYKDIRELMADLKAIYGAVDEQSALDALEGFAEKWDKKYPKISRSWREIWPNLSTYIKFPEADLHHQRHRRLQPAATESDQIQVSISNGRQPVQDAVSGHDGHHCKVDRQTQGLGHHPRAAGDFLQGPNPGVGEIVLVSQG